MKKALILFVIVCLSVCFMTACGRESEEEFYAGLEESRLEMKSDVSLIYQEMLSSGHFIAEGKIAVREYNGVTRDGWAKTYKDGDGNDKKYEWRESGFSEYVVYNNGDWYVSCTSDGVIISEQWYIGGLYYYFTDGNYQICGAESEIKIPFLGELFNYIDIIAGEELVSAGISRKIGKKIYSAERVNIDIIDASKEFKSGYGTETKYIWDNINGMTFNRTTFIAKKNRITSLEIMTENIIAYYNQKSVINQEKELIADICATKSYIYTVDYKKEAVLPPMKSLS